MYLVLKSTWFLLLLICLWLPELFASPIPRLGDVSRFVRLDIEQGLSHSTATALAQDNAGNIWIGTQNGLNRYDGFDVRTFRPGDAENASISDNFITSLQIDHLGILWVGTLNGLNRLDPTVGQFDRVNTVADVSELVVLSLHLDQQQLWVGTNQGLLLWHDASQRLIKPIIEQQQQWLHQVSITAITSNNQGKLWLGTSRGLFIIEPQQQHIAAAANFPFPKSAIMSLHYDNAGRLWVGLEHEGLLMQHPDTGVWQQMPVHHGTNDPFNVEIRTITSTADGDFWLGSLQGLSRFSFDNDHWQQRARYYHHRQNPNSLGGGRVVSILQDRDGSVWVGTWNGGVSRLNRANNLFTSVTPDLPLLDAAHNPAAISLFVDEQHLWAGMADGLYLLDLAQPHFALAASNIRRVTFYSAQDSGQHILFGHAQGLSRFDKHTQQYDEWPMPDALAGRPVRRLWATAEQLWLALDQLGIAILDRQTGQVIAQHPFYRAITFIRPLGQHYVLVGSYSGLSWFDKKTGRLLFEHKIADTLEGNVASLPSAPMTFITSDDGRYWLPSNGHGLLEMQLDAALTAQSARFVQYAAAEGLASGQLKAAELDELGNIWLSSASGISVFSPDTGRFRNFGYRHGALRRDYINYSSAKFTDGSIVFGGMDGFTMFQPSSVLADLNERIATPRIVSFELNNTPLSPQPMAQEAMLNALVASNKPLSIAASASRNFTVGFTTTEFIATNQVLFQYQLTPLSNQWITQDSANRKVNVDRLPPGHYTFKLRAGLSDSTWSDDIQLSLEVLPFWWETWQARLLLVCVLLALVLAIHSYRLKILQVKQQEMAWLVEKRTEALNDKTRALQDSKNKAELTLKQLESTMTELVRTEKMAALGQLVAGVAHEVNTPLGVALTANSVLIEESLMLQKTLEAGQIRRQDLDNYLHKLIQAGHLLDRNLHRAAQLITNFKQVSVDLTADSRRKFELAQYLDELLESLSLMWRNRPIQLEIRCPDDITMHSYPGTIGQIITNFAQNAIIHGFKNQEMGLISIHCTKQQDKVNITFADNGSGISPENLARIFDPFFTTNRFEGGTGLGLHIVYNLVTQKLGGSISVDSTVGKGTQFTLLLPLNIKPG